MLTLINSFWQIALFRRGPDSLPESKLLLAAAAGLYIFVSLLFILAQVPAASVFLLLAVDMLLLVGFCVAILGLYGCMERFLQTLTALLGTGALLQLLQISVAATSLIGLPQPVSMLGLIIILLWFIAVFGHIVSTALSKSFGVGVALAVAYVALSMSIAGEIPLSDEAHVETVSGNG